MSNAAAFIRRRAVLQAESVGTIQRATFANDNSASPVATWADHLQDIPVKVNLSSGSEGERYGRENGRDFGSAFVEAGQDITHKDRLVWNERTFDIQAVRTPDELTSGQPMSYTILDIEETAENTS